MITIDNEIAMIYVIHVFGYAYMYLVPQALLFGYICIYILLGMIL